MKHTQAQQESHETRSDRIRYIAEMEEFCGASAGLIDTLVDMVYLATADEDFLTPEACEWLDSLQEAAQELAEVWETGC